MKLRDYQQAAVDAVYDHLRNRDDNPCIVIPTGGGKTPVIATLCRDAVQRWNGRVLVLSHVRELLEQSAETLRRMAPDLDVGVYSAGLKQRDTNQPVIVAGIQSIYKRACELDAFDLILVDEAHLLPPDGEGMYRRFMADTEIVNPNVRLIGLTATPYRLKSGMLCAPENLLHHICFEVGVKELINRGFLSPLRTKAGKLRADYGQLHIRAGEFVRSEIETLMDTEDLVRSACREIANLTGDRKSVLIFAASVAHAAHVRTELQRITSSEVGWVTGSMDSNERAEMIERFKGKRIATSLFGDSKEPLKYLVNINVLTTGFDAPNVDCVVLLRPTASAGLYYQMVGRGFRLHSDKDDCLVLDYGDNILRHGPVDAIEIRERQAGKQAAPVKECPECQEVIHAAYSACPECGFAFPIPESQSHNIEASKQGILSGEVEETEFEVLDVFYNVHVKKDADEHAPRSMRVDYRVGLNEWQREWVCVEHSGFARKKAHEWWRQRSPDPVPETANRAVEIAEGGGLATPLKIIVRCVAGEKFSRIVGCELGPMPDPVEVEMEFDYDPSEIPF
ncbi:MAG: DEAD/DEAH box helicase family protein [Planctomycetota bacterium]